MHSEKPNRYRFANTYLWKKSYLPNLRFDVTL